jgi:clan AA aspartic protease (TIGR02281 family)
VWLAAGGIYRDGGVIGWALRWLLSCCGVALLCTGFLKLGPEFFLDRATKSQPVAHPVEISSPVNTLVYPANEQGHVILDAAVNGASMRLLVDTGASLVTLTPADAHAAGIAHSELVFDHRVSTANGFARMAPVILREIRIGQLSLYDVPAAVLENLHISLLGMSFLSRLQSYEMRDGKLTISW